MQRKRAPPRRTAPRRYAPRRRFIGKRVPRYTRRYSRYPSRVKGPSLPPKRFSQSRDWVLNENNTWAVQIDKTVPFDDYEDTSVTPSVTVPGVRQFATHKLQLPVYGGRTWQRQGNRIYMHGFRFTFKLHSQWTGNPSWLDGELHMAVIQQRDPVAFNMSPSFSSPIGAASNNDLTFQYFTDKTIRRSDAIKGKLRNPDYGVITHRKFYITKKLQNENRWFNKDVQFYLPIKKMIAFENTNEDYGTKPFHVMFWWVPHTNKHELSTVTGEQKHIYVDDFRYAMYFKNTQG
jgi:hypothetical protein